MRTLLVLVMLTGIALPASAGTTGIVKGQLTDRSTGAPIAHAIVRVSSPSQYASTVTDDRGYYVFMSLAPDTYTLDAEAGKHNAAIVLGMAVSADTIVTERLAMSRSCMDCWLHRTENQYVSYGGRASTLDMYRINSRTSPFFHAVDTQGEAIRYTSGVYVAPR